MKLTEKQLSESILAACEAAGIENPRYVAQDLRGKVYHYKSHPWHDDRAWIGNAFKIIKHPPYADDWQDSLLKWVDPQPSGSVSCLQSNGREEQ